MIKTLFLILITIFSASSSSLPAPRVTTTTTTSQTNDTNPPPVPPLGVFLVAGCGADFLINILLTLLGYFPGHIHAFYIEYVYVKRRDEVKAGIYNAKPAPGVYSKKVQNGGARTLPTANAPANAPVVVDEGVPAAQGYGTIR